MTRKRNTHRKRNDNKFGYKSLWNGRHLPRCFGLLFVTSLYVCFLFEIKKQTFICSRFLLESLTRFLNLKNPNSKLYWNPFSDQKGSSSYPLRRHMPFWTAHIYKGYNFVREVIYFPEILPPWARFVPSTLISNLISPYNIPPPPESHIKVTQIKELIIN